MPHALVELFARYGYLVIMAGVLLENAGVPAPGHTVVLAGAFLASRGTLSLPIVMAVAALSAIAGDNIGYWVGRRGGRQLVERHGKLLRLTPERVAKIDAFFARHGAKTVLFARFVTGLQTVAALFAGMSRMHWPAFLAFNVIGAVLWSAAYSAVGYFFGQSWELLHKWVGRIGLFGVALVAFALFFRFLKRNQRLRAWFGPALALGLLGVFAKIADDVQEHETTALDRAVSFGLHRLDSPVMDAAMRVFTFLGSFPPVAAVVLGFGVWRLRRKDRRGAAMIGGIAVATESINLVLKYSFQRARPSLFDEVATLHSYSFPSGHAMAATAIFGAAAVLIGRAAPRLERAALVIAAVLVLLVGMSRIFLGVHWVTDVLASHTAGGFVLLAGVYLLQRADRKALKIES